MQMTWQICPRIQIIRSKYLVQTSIQSFHSNVFLFEAFLVCRLFVPHSPPLPLLALVLKSAASRGSENKRRKRRKTSRVLRRSNKLPLENAREKPCECSRSGRNQWNLATPFCKASRDRVIFSRKSRVRGPFHAAASPLHPPRPARSN